MTQVRGTSRAMAADADIVLNTASDLTRAPAWLPAPVQVVGTGAGTVDLRWREEGVHRYEIDLDAAGHRLAWHPAGDGAWAGELRVTEQGAGSSRAELLVEAGDDVDAGEVRTVLDAALEALAAEVDQNFTVS
ncbi:MULTISPECIES: hypothetical protein [unclassified Amycolatopsis]|uniref:hypothetical protein n=1 Tax=unclassified Amycolatopsis TaxID=2618356 RepID=UPI00287550E8|nr:MULTISPECIES: hypothetical protein [unclassified Amycolatopsis]MDS0134655.1 hypothetical protein [Amycolatopsis sp. 505]MDS0147446.1 hypothetical protein [Amycolatopsis sp. CM201R]